MRHWISGDDWATAGAATAGALAPTLAAPAAFNNLRRSMLAMTADLLDGFGAKCLKECWGPGQREELVPDVTPLRQSRFGASLSPPDRERPFGATLGLRGVCLNERFGGKMSAASLGRGILRPP